MALSSREMAVANGYIDPSFMRTARKAHRCQGSGGSPNRHAPECPGEIKPGLLYLEYVGEVGAFQSGRRVSLACADAFFKEV